MANFVESATLRVVDQSSGKLGTIKRAIAQFTKEAVRAQKALNKSASFKVNTGNLKKATAQVNQLNAALAKSGRQPVNPKVSVAGINSAIRRVDVLIARMKQSSQPNQGTINPPRTPRGAPPGSPGPVSPRGGRNPQGGPAFGRQQVSLNISPLQSWAMGFYSRLRATIENAIMSGFGKGLKDTSDSDARLKLLGYDKDTRSEIDRRANDMSKDYKGAFTRTDVATLFAELGPIMGKDPLKSQPLVDAGLKWAGALKTSGQTTEQAVSGVRAVMRSLDNMNQVQDDKGGISPNFNKYFDVIMQEMIRSGQDITGQNLDSAVKFSRTTGKTLNPEGLRTLLNLLESMGKVSGSSLNRFVESVGGGTKAALREQEKWGLITTKEVDEGSTGKKRNKKIAVDQVVDGEFLREDPDKWFAKNLIPKLVEKGVDITNAAETAKALSPLFSSVVARDIALNMAMWTKEQQASLEASKNIDVSKEGIQKNMSENPNLAIRNVQDQFVEALGQTANALTLQFLPAIQTVSEWLRMAAEWVRGDDPNNPSATRGVVAGGAGLLGLVGGAKLFQSLIGATGLNTSAGLLSKAAYELMAAARGDMLGDLGGKKGKGGWFDWVKDLVKKPGTVAGGALVTSGSGAALETAGVAGLTTSIASLAAAMAPFAATTAILTSDKFGTKDPETLLDMKAQLAKLQAEIAANKANEKIPGASDLPNQSLQIQADMLKDQIQVSSETIDIATAKSTADLAEAFSSGGLTISERVQGTAGPWGDAASSKIQNAADAFGARAAAAMNANFKPAPLSVNVTSTSGPDVGTNTNAAR